MQNKCRSVSKGVSVDSKISILKPIRAKWMTRYYGYIRTDKDIVKNRWRRSGITKAIKENIRKENPFEN